MNERMRLPVMRRAKPYDVERAAVVRVVRFRPAVALRYRAYGPRNHPPIPDCIPECNVRSPALWKVFQPSGVNRLCCLDSLRALCSIPVVAQNSFSAFPVPVIVNILLCAGLALVQMAVSHLAVSIEVRERLLDAALKARLHVDPQKMRAAQGRPNNSRGFFKRFALPAHLKGMSPSYWFCGGALRCGGGACRCCWPPCCW